MKKTMAVMIVLLLGCCGYLYYDWQTKTKKLAAEPHIPQYSYTDAQGTQHFTDRPPPKGATNIKETKGYEYTEQPLVISVREAGRRRGFAANSASEPRTATCKSFINTKDSMVKAPVTTGFSQSMRLR